MTSERTIFPPSEKQLVDQLHRVFLSLAPIPAAEWQDFLARTKKRSFGRGEFLARAGAPVVEIGYVAKGLFRLFYAADDGSEWTKEFRVEGGLIGPYSALLTNEPNDLNIVALEDSVVVCIAFTDLQKFFDRHPCWQEVGRRIAEGLYVERERREKDLLTLDAKARLVKFMRENAPFKGRVPKNLLASYLGITAVSLSRLLRQVGAEDWNVSEGSISPARSQEI